MLKLMKLELQRVNLRAYLLSCAVFGGILLAAPYFVAYVAQVEQETQFMNYGNILRFVSALSILMFGVLSAAMYSRLIIEEYTGKRLALLFSYPGSRKKIFLAKILVVFLFVMLSMLLCTGIPIAVFSATETFAPIVSDTMSEKLLLPVFQTLLISLTAVSAIGLLAMRIGFLKKSVPATLITAFLLSGLYGNIAIGSTRNALLILGVSLVTIVIVLIALSRKINQMEVE